jgi:nicotinamidase-related amidase
VSATPLNVTGPVAFVDVDTQVDFIEPHGLLYAQGAEAIKPTLAKLVAHARAVGIPLISSADAHSEGDPELSQYPPHCFVGTPGQARIAETTTGAEVVVPSSPLSELPDPKTAHVLLEKQEFSLFSNANAEALFAAAGAKTFVVFGVVTEVCIWHAVTALRERGYDVLVVEDAIWPIDQAKGDASKQEFLDAGARLVTAAEVLALTPEPAA